MATMGHHSPTLRVLIKGGADINIGDKVMLKCIEMYICCMLLMMSKLIMYMCTSVHLCVSMHLSMCILLQMSVTVLYPVYKSVHNILHVHCSSGSRGGSMGSYELPFYSRPVNDVHTVANLLQKHPSASVPTAEFAFSLCEWSKAYLALSAKCVS